MTAPFASHMQHDAARNNPAAVGLGVLFTTLVHAGLLAWIVLPKLFSSESQGHTPSPELITEVDLVSAEMVRKGMDLPDHLLPNRRVNVLNTAPQVGVGPNTAEAKPRPPNAVDDLLNRLGTRAQNFAEQTDQLPLEGNPDGAEDGTSESAREGDLYAGRLKRFLETGWSVPSTMDADLVRGMSVRVDITVDANLQITSYDLKRSSGDVEFDQSVKDRLEGLIATQTPLPPPPESVLSQYAGNTFSATFHGRNLR